MPVPSTIRALRLTRVFTPEGRVSSLTACIMGMGPTATTWARGSRASSSFKASVTRPFRPQEPSSVVMMSSSLAASSSSARSTRSRLRPPRMVITRWSLALSASAAGRMAALP